MVVGPNELFRNALRGVVEKSAALEHCGECSDLEHAVTLSDLAKPDVVLIGQRLLSPDDVQASRSMRNGSPSLRTMVITPYLHVSCVAASVLSGASAVVLMQIGGSERLTETIERVARGENMIQPAMTSSAVDLVRRLAGPLDQRQERVLDLVAEHATDAEIARAVSMDAGDVRRLVSTFVHRLEVREPVE